jgi:hypothetical protein
MKLTRGQRLACVVLGVALVWAVVHFTGLKSQISVQLLQEEFQRHRLTGLLVFAALFVLGNLIQVPGWVFLVAAVVALGPVWGGLVTYFAACISCVATFWVIRRAGCPPTAKCYVVALGLSNPAGAELRAGDVGPEVPPLCARHAGGLAVTDRPILPVF